jgi:hypothetical protein
MTPKETALAFAGAAWRQEQARENNAWLAWHMAALGRVKRLPPLRRFIHPVKGEVTPEELDKKKREFEAMKENSDRRRRGTRKSTDTDPGDAGQAGRRPGTGAKKGRE